MVNFAFIFHLTPCWRMVEFVCHFTPCLYMVEFVCHFTPCLYMVYCLHHANVWSNLLYIWHHAYVLSNLLDIWHHAYVWSNLLMFDTMLMYGRFAIYLRTMLTYLNMYDQLLLSFYFLLLLLLHFVYVNLCLNELIIFLWYHSDIWSIMFLFFFDTILTYGQLCFCFSLILYLDYEFILQLMVWLFRWKIC